MGIPSALHFIPKYWTVPYRAATKSRMVPSQYWVARFQRSYHYPNFIKASIAFRTDHQSAAIGMPETEEQNKTNANFELLNNPLIKQKCKEKSQLSLILPRSRMGTVCFYTSTSNKRAARPKLHKVINKGLKTYV